ncbi:hypothetical protein M758_UG044300 [Ceratodon purpureus]|nr:hypothetical protein M758_UG044300 [Ceratodon purpureus]
MPVKKLRVPISTCLSGSFSCTYPTPPYPLNNQGRGGMLFSMRTNSSLLCHPVKQLISSLFLRTGASERHLPTSRNVLHRSPDHVLVLTPFMTAKKLKPNEFHGVLTASHLNRRRRKRNHGRSLVSKGQSSIPTKTPANQNLLPPKPPPTKTSSHQNPLLPKPPPTKPSSSKWIIPSFAHASPPNLQSPE